MSTSKNAHPQHPGQVCLAGYFVISRAGGLYWTGKDWTNRLLSAKKWVGPLLPGRAPRSTVGTMNRKGVLAFLMFYPGQPPVEEPVPRPRANSRAG